MESYHIEHSQEGDIGLVRIQGYFNAEAATDLQKAGEEILAKKILKIVLDFSACPSVNSPGAVAILDFCLKVTDDFRGRVIIFGLNQLKQSFFEMVGIFPVATYQPSWEEAKRALAS